MALPNGTAVEPQQIGKYHDNPELEDRTDLSAVRWDHVVFAPGLLIPVVNPPVACPLVLLFDEKGILRGVAVTLEKAQQSIRKS